MKCLPIYSYTLQIFIMLLLCIRQGIRPYIYNAGNIEYSRGEMKINVKSKNMSQLGHSDANKMLGGSPTM